jgi:hypothetical protein
LQKGSANGERIQAAPLAGILGLQAVDIGQELDFGMVRSVTNFHQEFPTQRGKQPAFDSG